VAPSPEAAVEQSADRSVDNAGFSLTLSNFSGPFDLLLSLITKHELDITEGLAECGDRRIHLVPAGSRGRGPARRSERVPRRRGDPARPEGRGAAAARRARRRGGCRAARGRDLLFARLLQYRAFKEAAAWVSGASTAESTRHYRSVRLEEKYRKQTPELVWTLSLDDFAALALSAFAPHEIPVVGLDHLHAPLVSIREQAAHVVAHAARRRSGELPALIAGAEQRGVIVAASWRCSSCTALRALVRAAGTARRADHALDGRPLDDDQLANSRGRL
jgi:segregation and condensation protein A